MTELPRLASTHLYDVLRLYRDSEHAENWLAATVVSKYRSSYRQPGAMMLVNPLGQTFGLISGGCLEANIVLQARKVQALGVPICMVYDTTDEENIAAELGLGCNGRVEVLIQELTEDHRKTLLALLARMQSGQRSYLLQCFATKDPAEMRQLVLLDEHYTAEAGSTGTALPDLSGVAEARHQIVTQAGRSWSLSLHRPPISFWVFGGGIDARPVVQMASQLGWRVTLVDHRISHARDKDFPGAERILRQRPGELEQSIDADAAVLMSHNLDNDAAWLRQLQQVSTLSYLGLLGPVERKREALEIAQINSLSDFAQSIHGPMGFDIGGDIPESVALSVLAQCHQVLHKHELKGR